VAGSLNRSVNRNHPIAWSRRWGFFFWMALGALLGGGLTGCAGPSPEDYAYHSEAGFIASTDSLGLEEFLALEPAHRKARRDQAEIWLERSRSAAKAEDRVQALILAAGLTPDDPEIWLQLAKIWRWVGDNLRTKSCLTSAAASVRQLGRKSSDLANRSRNYKKDAALRTATLRAWHHYDRAEFYEGLKWANAGVQLEPGNALALQVQGLLEASLGHRSRAHEIADDIQRNRGYHTDTAWIQSTLDRSWGRNREAFNYYLNLRPIEDHAAECWRDMGLAAERVGEWSYARRWYRESAAALPFEDTSSLVEISHDRLDSRARSSHQPVWVAFGRYFVTGSRSAFTACALERFEQAETPEQKDTWAGLLVNSAGICIRMNEDKPWALRARGIVFSRTGKEDRGLEDLRRASKGLKEMGLQDGRVEAEIGHLLLKKEQQQKAIRNLRRAVELDAEYAAAWRDLGLALIMAGDPDEAEKALTKSLELDPSSVTAWYNRGLLNMHAGRFEQAEQDLKKAAELAPENQDVARLLQQVNRRKTE
jgi:tetratricopeptide (TPR) repeat protein